MLSFDDSRWAELSAGYGTPIDLRPMLSELETALEPEVAWGALWEALHHQGDVGHGSYVAVPHLVRIHRQRATVDWNPYALVATIELARGKRGNPDVLECDRPAYTAALHALAACGLRELPTATDQPTVRSILALLAIVYGAPTYGRLLVEFTEDEVLELEKQAFVEPEDDETG
jgi:hypothetical protein